MAISVAGIFAGLRFAGSRDYETALGRVAISVKPHLGGEINLFIPLADWGVIADAFDAPLEIDAEPQSINRDAVLKAAAGNGSVLTRAEADARDAARIALIRALVTGTLGALGLGLILALALAGTGRGSRRILLAAALAPAACAAVLMAASIFRASTTFDQDSFRQPDFYARGSELGQLLEAAENAQESGASYASSIRDALSGFATVLAAGGRLTRIEQTRGAILASDLHGNLGALDALRGIFDDEPVFFVGDFGHSGNRAEANTIAPRIARLGRRVVAVSGNHDSAIMMRALVRSGVEVLTSKGRLKADGGTDGRPVQQILGMRVAGYEDPLQDDGPDPGAPGRIFSFSELPGGDHRFERAERRLIAWFRRLNPQPEVLLVHENGLAQGLARSLNRTGITSPLTILTGHDHKQHIDLFPSITVVDAGTIGAGGLVQGASGAVGLANLHFARERNKPVAVDLLQVDAVTGAARAHRTPIGEPGACRGEDVRCHGVS